MIRVFSAPLRTILATLLTALSFSTSTAQADGLEKCDDHGVTHDVSRYEQLAQYYRSSGAHAPNPASLEGWWIGRCYFAEHPTQGVGSLLWVTREGRHSYQTWILTGERYPADRFDQITFEERNLLTSSVEEMLANISLATQYPDGSWGSEDWYGNRRDQIKINGGLLVGTITTIHDEGTWRAGETRALCSWPERAPEINP